MEEEKKYDLIFEDMQLSAEQLSSEMISQNNLPIIKYTKIYAPQNNN